MSDFRIFLEYIRFRVYCQHSSVLVDKIRARSDSCRNIHQTGDPQKRIPRDWGRIQCLLLLGRGCSSIKHGDTKWASRANSYRAEFLGSRALEPKFFGILSAFLFQYVLRITWDFLEQKWDKRLQTEKSGLRLGCWALKVHQGLFIALAVIGL